MSHPLWGKKSTQAPIFIGFIFREEDLPFEWPAGIIFNFLGTVR